MTQDSSISPSTASVNESSQDKRLPNGIHIVRAEDDSARREEGVSNINQEDAPWGFINIPRYLVKKFENTLESDRLVGDFRPRCFVHRTVITSTTSKKSEDKGKSNSTTSKKSKDKGKSNSTTGKNPKDKNGANSSTSKNTEDKSEHKIERLTLSGMVFLQGSTRDLTRFLQNNFLNYNLVRDCSTHRPASIKDSVMRPFMQLAQTEPDRVTILRDPFEKIASGHVKLRVLTGLFAGMEGYVVRIKRDRQLVLNLGGKAVAISNVHNEDFEVIEEDK